LVGELSAKLMRIISGKLKGKSIQFIKNSTTRPLRDSVKENIFNLLIHSKFLNIKIEEASILDLYSGIGSFGIECISRGAKNVAFIENDPVANETIKKNLNHLLIFEKAKIFKDNVSDFLKRNINEKYNIFFFDPPYADKSFINNLDLIKKNKLFQKNHIVIIHRDVKTKDYLDNLIKIIIEKKYGRSKIIFGLFTD
tara:strand:+ start:1232 stop:1822 length:591 start_codon:yes stop_codon:yes gene_type:complete